MFNDSNDNTQTNVSSHLLVSRDEMNLVEFPLTVLSTRVDPKVKTLEFKDSIITNNEKIERHWIVTGTDKFGLPTSSDDEVLLGLLKLTVDDQFKSQKVQFTRYELLKILRWTTEGKSYNRLQKALDRLSGVRIKASNAFFDNSSKVYRTKNFGIIDAYEINDGRDTSPKPSFFTWSEEIFESFQSGFIKKLDLDFYLNLKSAVSKRLYRYLDKIYWYKSVLRINLFTLAHEKIGVSRNYKYASMIRQQMDPAFDELIKLGFLSDVQYEGQGQGSEVIIYSGRGKPRSLAKGEESPREKAADNSVDLSNLPPLAQQLIARGVAEAQAVKLISGKNTELLNKISKIIQYYDYLMTCGSQLISRSPVGFLYRAIEKADTFVLPDSFGGNNKEVNKKPNPAVSTVKNEDQYKIAYEAFISSEVTRLLPTLEVSLIEDIKNKVSAELAQMKKLISEVHFQKTVKHRLEQRIAKLLSLPSYAEWRKDA